MSDKSGMPNYNRTRWLTLAGTILTQLALGSVYTWSLFNGQLSEKLGEPVSRIALTFGILSLCLALSSSVAGQLQERFGVRNVTIAAGLLMDGGVCLTAHSDDVDRLYIRRGVLAEIGRASGWEMREVTLVGVHLIK